MDASREHRVAVAIAAGLLVLYAAVVPFVSVSGTGDTPCGSLVDRSFPWERSSGCSVGYTAVAGVVVWFAATAVALTGAVAGAAGAIRRATWWILGTSAVVGTTAWAVLAWVAWAPSDAVMHRGWVSARNAVGFATLFLVALASVVAVRSLRGAEPE